MSTFASECSEPAEYASDHTLLITVEQLAIRLQVSKRSLFRLKSEGKLPAPVKLRNSVRWRVLDIEEWVANGCPPCSSKG